MFNLQAALASGLARSGFVGTVRLGLNPVGMTVSAASRAVADRLTHRRACHTIWPTLPWRLGRGTPTPQAAIRERLPDPRPADPAGQRRI